MARILVVEDDPDIRALVVRRLQHGGHAVKSAGGAVEALESITDKQPPDVVVLDVNMPDLDGFELLRRLRDCTGNSQLNAIFLSGRMKPEDIAAGRALGAVYLTKPFVGTSLISAIDKLLAAEAARFAPEEEW